jgi:hypothetical protein
VTRFRPTDGMYEVTFQWDPAGIFQHIFEYRKICLCFYVYIEGWVDICILISICMNVCTLIFTHVFRYLFKLLLIRSKETHQSIPHRTYAPVLIYIFIYIYIHISIWIFINVCTCIFILIYIQTFIFTIF